MPSTSTLPKDNSDIDVLDVIDSFDAFCKSSGIRHSVLTQALMDNTPSDMLDTPLGCVAYSTPPQEGKTTWVVHFMAWQLIRNPWLHVVYATYSQGRANAVSRQVRDLVQQWTPLKTGSTGVELWQTREGGGLLAAGRGSAMTGFSSDFTVIDDPIKDMVEAQSETIRSQITSWFQSVVLTRMAHLSEILVIATRWHKDDLIAHVVNTMQATYINVPAQATTDDDVLARQPGEWLQSVQGRTPSSWSAIKRAQGTYVWQALYQGDPKVVGGSIINVDNIDVIPWDNVVYKDDHGFIQTLDRAIVIQSWDLSFGTAKRSKGGSISSGDYVAGQVWAWISGTWILVDRVHERCNFTRQVSLVQQMAARWPQTSRIYVEQAANGAALLDTLKRRAALIKPVIPHGSKEARALAIQPEVDGGLVKMVDTVVDPELFEELRTFPFAPHDDQVDAMTQAISQGKTDYIRME